MNLKELQILNFKNYNHLKVSFSENLNCITGLNGIGKTNILDAIYYLSFCKSYFNLQDSFLVKHNESSYLIKGEYFRKHKKETLAVAYEQEKRRKISRNSKPYKKLSDHIGLFPLVMISPSDISLIYEGSDIRRKFIDSVISQFNRPYLENLLKYNKVLQQRNALLKSFSENRYFDETMIGMYDQQLVKYGVPIFNERKKFIDDFVPVFNKYYNIISGDKEEVKLSYNSKLNEQGLLELLQNSIIKDKALRYTSVGIHKDDLNFELSALPIKKLGSQGQQKTYLIGLRFAQYELIKNRTGINPILLLDDIFDKLDKQRVSAITKLVGSHEFGQIFITDTDKKRVNSLLKEMNEDSMHLELKGENREFVNEKI